MEIKCKRCGIIKSISGILGSGHPKNGYALLVTKGDQGVHILDASASSASVLGYSQAELCTKRLCDIDAQLPEGIYDHLWNAIRSQSPSFSIDTFQQPKIGKPIPVCLSFNFFELDRNSYAFVMADIPAPQEEIPRYAVLVRTPDFIKSMCEFFCEVDPDGRYTRINQGVVDSLGYPVDDLVGHAIFDGPIHDVATGSQIKSLFARQKPFRIQQCALHCKDGSDRYRDVCFMPLFTAAGSFIGYQIAGWSSPDYTPKLV